MKIYYKVINDGLHLGKNLKMIEPNFRKLHALFKKL